MISIEAGGAIQVIMLSFFGFLVFVGGFFTSSNLGDLKTASDISWYWSYHFLQFRIRIHSHIFR